MSSENQTYQHSSAVIAILLSGGEGRRVGGRDKGLIDFNGKYMVEWVIQRIGAQVDDIVLSVNRNEREYSKLGYQLVADDAQHTSQQGPLAGIVSAVSKIQMNAGFYLICTCDSPHLPTDYVAKLKDSLGSPDVAASVVFDGTTMQNLHCLIRAQAITSLIDFYKEGGRAMRRWFAENNIVQVDFSSQAEAFANYNTSESIR